MALTVESLMLEVGQALAPLEQRLRAGEVGLFFAQLGLPAPDTVLGEQRVRDAVGAAAEALGDLPVVLSALSDAIASENTAEIARAAGRAVTTVRAATAAIDAVTVEVAAAAEAAGPSRTEVEAFAAELAERLFGFAVASYLEGNQPAVAHLFTLLGIIEISAHAATPATPAHIRRVLRFDRLAALFQNPVNVLAQVYGWGSAEFDWDKLLLRLSILLGRVSNFTFVQPGPPPFLRIVGVDIGRTGDPVPGVQAVLRVTSAEGLDLTRPIGAGVASIAIADAALDLGTAVQLLPPAHLHVVPPTTEVRGKLRFGFQAPPAAAEPPMLVFGAAGGSRIEARTLRIAAGADLVWNVIDRRAEGAFVLEAGLEGGKFVLSLAGADGFLTEILPSVPLELEADLRIRWSSATGLRFDGEAGLRTTRVVQRQFGLLRLDIIDLALTVASDTLTGTVAVTGGVVLGPVTATVTSVGTIVALRFERGNLGLGDLSLTFKPPTGLGIAIDASAVVGGGHLDFDPEKGEYSGLVHLEIADRINVKAFGLLSTRLPDGARGYSLILFITAEGFQPIQLGMGFKLEGIGGMLAVNRTFDEEAMRDGLKNNTLATLLFPTDPVRNAPAILRSLATVFPAKLGSYLFGPLAKIGWATPTLITLDLALILEIGARRRLILLGRISSILPSRDKDLIRLNMDAMGVFDLDAGTMAMDAVLVDSRLLQKFVLTGATAMRACLVPGPRAAFALAVGGMNPHYAPPAGMPSLERITISLTSGDNPRLTCSAYFAVTANTIQFGSRSSMYAAAYGFTIEGDVGFDVLVQLLPFHFLAEFQASVQLRRGSHYLFMVKVSGALEGPRPLRVSAKATFEILWCDFSVHFDKTLIEGEAPPPPPAVSPLDELRRVLGLPASWTADLPADRRHGVITQRSPGTGALTLDPAGEVVVRQSVVPLNTGRELDLFGGAPLGGARRFAVTAALNTTLQSARPTRDLFAPAQFFDLSDDEKLGSPSFEEMDSGLAFGNQGVVFDESGAELVEAPLEYETITLDEAGSETPSGTPYTPDAARVRQQLRVASVAKAAVRHTGLARFRGRGAGASPVAVQVPKWVVASTSDLARVSPASAGGLSWSEARAALAAAQQSEPDGKRRWQLMPAYEQVP